LALFGLRLAFFVGQIKFYYDEESLMARRGLMLLFDGDEGQVLTVSYEFKKKKIIGIF